MKKVLGCIGIGIATIVALFVIIQLVPYGRRHANPPVIKEPVWDSPQTKELASRACFDCHSNETLWPWYTNIAPFSWLIQHDVDEGRARLNFSECGIPRSIREDREAGEGLREAGEIVLEGEMPPAQYLLMHPNANLTTSERELLANGLNSSLCK